MTTRSRPHPAAKLLADAGPTVSVPETATVLGISSDTAYALAKRGELGVRVLRYGRKLRVPTADLRRVLGIEDGAT
ncbi:MAG: helix-turn-helix domain-containing protein [Pseudonocardiaceae bacterium]